MSTNKKVRIYPRFYWRIVTCRNLGILAKLLLKRHTIWENRHAHESWTGNKLCLLIHWYVNSFCFLFFISGENRTWKKTLTSYKCNLLKFHNEITIRAFWTYHYVLRNWKYIVLVKRFEIYSHCCSASSLIWLFILSSSICYFDSRSLTWQKQKEITWRLCLCWKEWKQIRRSWVRELLVKWCEFKAHPV